MLFDAEEADVVAKQHVALDFVRKMAGRDKLKARGRTHFVSFRGEIGRGRRFYAVGRPRRSGQHPVDAGAGGVEEKVLAPLVEGDAPWVRDVELGGAFQLATIGVVTEEAPVHAADGAVGGFHIGMEEDPFREDEGAGGIRAVGTDGVVGIVSIEAAQHDLAEVGLVVTVGIAKEHQVGFLGNVDAFWRELETDR